MTVDTIFRAFEKSHADLPGYVILIRMGDFYEAIDADARIVSDVCGVALSKFLYQGVIHPLAGIPYHAIYGYVDLLTAAGHKVDVVELKEKV